MENVENLVIAGMGGSGIVGDALIDLASHYLFPIRITVVKNSYMPFKLNPKKDLVIALSYSGNTRETMAVVKETIDFKTRVVAISSDGALEKEKDKVACYIKLTEGLYPRADFPEMFFAVLYLLAKNKLAGRLAEQKILESVKVFQLNLQEEVENIAKILSNKLPIFITLHPYKSVALRMKNDLAENAKQYSIVEELPEASHNSIEAIVHGKTLSLPFEILAVGGRYLWKNLFFEAFSSTLSDAIHKVDLSRSELLEELLLGFYMSAKLSLRLADMYGILPERTDAIDLYKVNLKRLSYL